VKNRIDPLLTPFAFCYYYNKLGYYQIERERERERGNK